MKVPIKKAKMQFPSKYIGDLRSSIGYYVGWVPQEYADKVTDADAYEMLKNDEAVSHALDLLALFSAGERVSITVKDRILSFLLNKAINNICDFQHTLKSLIFNGTLFGLSLQKKEYDKIIYKEFPSFAWCVPKQVIEVDRRRLRIERDTKDRMLTYWTLWVGEEDSYVVMEDMNICSQYEGPYLQDYMWFFFEREELNPYYRGLGEVLFRLVYAKSKLIQYWTDLAESWSKPYVIATIDTMRGVLDSNQGAGFNVSADTRMRNLLDKIQNMVARHTLVLHNNGDDVKFHEHGSTGNNILKEFINYIDQRITLCILGAELTTGTGSGVGSYAMAQVHRSATQSKVIYGRARLEERIKEDLVWDFIYRNKKNLIKMRVPIPSYDEIKVEIKVESEDLQKMMIQQGEQNAKKVQQGNML